MRRGFVLALSALALGTGACTLLFGDYHVGTGGDGGATSTSSTSTSATSGTTGSGGSTSTSASNGGTGGIGGGTATTSSSTTTSSNTGTTSTSSTSSATGHANGQLCTADAECQSGHCYQGAAAGVCCATACNGSSSNPCGEACDLSLVYQPDVISWAGQCLPVTPGLQGSCPSNQYCSQAKGGCTTGLRLGAACTSASQCATGRCVASKCQSPRQPPGYPCSNHYDCLSNTCDTATFLCQ